MGHTPTPEQEAIIQAGKTDSRSMMIGAYAGCAKSTTGEMLVHALPPTRGLGIAFNKKIATELEKRFPADWTLKTLNGLGHGAWGKAIGKRLTLEDRKLGLCINELAKEWGLEKLSMDAWQGVRQLVSWAMTQGLVPSEYPNASLVPDTPESWRALADDQWIEISDDHLDFARGVLIASIRQSFAGVISFDDQIYMSAMFNGVFQKYPLVFIDESQDLSPLNHIQLARSAHGRIISVGDPKQAIYAFRGADNASMEKIKRLRKDWIELPLATTFRCPKAMVARQIHHAPGFTAYHTNRDGRVVDWRTADGRQWSWADVESELEIVRAAGADPSLFVVCRNNAPLVKMAFRLIRRGVGVQMLGRDIGKGLVALSRKIVPDDFTPAPKTMAMIREWADSQISIALANQDESKAERLRDQSESLVAVMETSGIRDAGELRAKLTDLFTRDKGQVVLSTGHRVKGLERQVVIHLDPWRLPSKYAKQQAADGDYRALTQDLNLLYVIETRPQHTLINADLEMFK